MPARTASPRCSTPTPRRPRNNGSAFAGLTGNTPFYNLTGAVSMFVGRFWMIVPAMAIAGSLAHKKTVAASSGTFPTTGGLFVGLLVGVILIVGGLTFFPALALGPDRRTSRDAGRHRVLSRTFGVAIMETSKLRKRTPASDAARSGDRAAGDRPGLRQARSAHAGEEPGDVRARDRHAADHRAAGPRHRHRRGRTSRSSCRS